MARVMTMSSGFFVVLQRKLAEVIAAIAIEELENSGTLDTGGEDG